MARPRRLLLLLCGLAVCLGAAIWWRTPRTPTLPTIPGLSQTETRRLLEHLDTLEAQERNADATFWAPETLARRCGQTVDRLWDALNASNDRWTTLAESVPGELVLPRWGGAKALPHGLAWHGSTGAGATLGSADDIRRQIEAVRAAGWQLERTEWRHVRFATNAAGGPAHSFYRVSAWLTHPPATRLQVQGEMRVDWSPQPEADGQYRAWRCDASALEALERQGPVPWREVFLDTVAPPDRSFFIDPLLLHDLDGDGLSELVLAARNRVYRRTAQGGYTGADLCRHPPGLILSAVFGDFDGDGRPDYLVARFDGLMLYRGSEAGRFDEPGHIVWLVEPHLRYAQVMTAGDIDGDGDLDIWLGQYKSPYDRGQMPTPYHDALDGHPAYLLLNDGQGRFRDGTVEARLDPRRMRRTYSASLVDLTGDGALDLLVVSDFAGVDAYRNDGQGHFAEAREMFRDPLGFGMAHAFADFDGDGRTDVFVTGMHCPTAGRLEALGLTRPGFEARDAFRGRMIQGNRLYLQREGGYATTDLNASVAYSGWAWGCSAADFDNDGYPDLYIPNGHETRQSVTDYDAEFWLHDIYVATSRDDLDLAAYFGAKFGRTRGQGQSYGGYDANRLFLNQGGRSFVEAGWLLGVALEPDSRVSAADDLDGDGRLDLVVTTFEVWPQVRQTLRVFRNEMPDVGHWLGLRVQSGPRKPSPLGVRATVSAGGRQHEQVLVAGDGHRRQSPWTLHFGLGTVSTVDRVDLQWPGGSRATLLNPQVDRFHVVAPHSAPSP